MSLPKSLKTRKIRFDLILIQLLAISLLLVTFFFMVKHVASAIPKLAFRELGKVVAEKTADSLEQIKVQGKITGALIEEKGALTRFDSLIRNYLFNFLRVEAFVSGVDIVTEDGRTLSITTLPPSTGDKGESNIHRYLLKAGETTGSVFKTSSQYYTSDFTPNSSRTLRTDTDPRTEPWYQESRESLSDFIMNQPSSGDNQARLALIFPLRDSSNKFTGAMKFYLSMSSISRSIDRQKVGLAGEVYVLNENGTPIFPLLKDIPPHEKTLLQEGYKTMVTGDSQSFILRKDNDQFYFNFFDLNYSVGADWYILSLSSYNKGLHEAVIKNSRRLYPIIIIIIASILLTLLLSRYISNPIIKLAAEVEKLKDFDFKEASSLNSHIYEIKLLEDSIHSMRSIIQAFSLYIPKDIVKKLIQRGDKIGIGGEKSNLTLFFCDIADFTEKCESLEVESLFSLLSDYFDNLSKTIIENEGTIDKYIGDSIMAFWGAPTAVDESQKKACITALRIENECHKKENLTLPLPWNTRIGIHCGEVIVGNIGTPERINYTAIGDSVNTCSRLEAINKQYNTSIIISQEIEQAIGTEFVTRPLDCVAVKGKKNRLIIYELVGVFGEEPDLAPSERQVSLCNSFREAYTLLMNNKKEEAKAMFLAIQEQFPEDMATKIHLQRLAEED